MVDEPPRDVRCPTIVEGGVDFRSTQFHWELDGFGQSHPPPQQHNKFKGIALPALYARHFIPGDEMKLEVSAERDALVVSESESEGMEIQRQEKKKTDG
jgi:hypothetical protein